MSEDEQASWREQRRSAAEAHAAAAERQRAAETEQARQLVHGFVEEARRRGLRVTALRARGYDGRGTYRTGLEGWYLRRNRSLAVGTDGEFYILTVPPSLLARVTGATVAPSDPPLAVGRGARDGESVSLQELLRLRLEAGDDWGP